MSAEPHLAEQSGTTTTVIHYFFKSSRVTKLVGAPALHANATTGGETTMIH